MNTVDSANRALTEIEMTAISGGRGFFNEIIAKGMAIEHAKQVFQETWGTALGK